MTDSLKIILGCSFLILAFGIGLVFTLVMSGQFVDEAQEKSLLIIQIEDIQAQRQDHYWHLIIDGRTVVNDEKHKLFFTISRNTRKTIDFHINQTYELEHKGNMLHNWRVLDKTQLNTETLDDIIESNH